MIHKSWGVLVLVSGAHLKWAKRKRNIIFLNKSIRYDAKLGEVVKGLKYQETCKMAINCWLMKSEPNDFSIMDLINSPDQTVHWDGVRNYQARNFMRDKMRIKDRVLFYHSVVKPSVVGTARVVKAGYPDFTAWDPKSKHFDPKSTPKNPIWYMVDIRFESQFAEPIPLTRLRTIPGLKNMLLLRKGMRLSIQPVTKKEFDIIVAMGNP